MCRRRILLGYFGEVMEKDCGNCDICSHPPRRFNGTILAQKALSAIVRTREQENANMIIDILRGSRRAEVLEKGYDKIKTFGVGASTPADKWQSYIQQMIHLGCLTMSYTDKRTLRITDFGKQVLFGDKEIQLALVADQISNNSSKASSAGIQKVSVRLSAKDNLEGSDAILFEALRIHRRNLADAANVPPYVIFSDKVLLGMVQERPSSLAEMANLPGIGTAKLQKYGKDFLQIINAEK